MSRMITKSKDQSNEKFFLRKIWLKSKQENGCFLERLKLLPSLNSALKPLVLTRKLCNCKKLKHQPLPFMPEENCW